MLNVCRSRHVRAIRTHPGGGVDRDQHDYGWRGDPRNCYVPF